MRKYKMCLGWRYRLRHFFSFDKTFSGKVISFRIMCEYGFDIDLRKGGFKITDLLTPTEKKRFNLGMWLRKHKN